MTSSTIPRRRIPDETAGLLRDGYLFGIRRFDRMHTDAFQTRLALRSVVVMRGRDAARFFSEGGRFTRAAAMPASATHLLQDAGSVQQLEGEAHAARKHEFIELLGVSARTALVETFAREWERAFARPRMDGRPVVLQRLFSDILARSAATWCGIPDVDSVAAQDGRRFAEMIEGAGRVGPPNWAARTRRHGVERRAAELVDEVRTGRRPADDASALARISALRDSNGAELPREVAAVELLNLIRPIVAVGRFLVFAALALRRRPDWAERFRDGQGDSTELRAFVDEVRRFYPFFPMIAGRASTGLAWHGHRFVPGDTVALDLYATDHDERLWPDAERFLPERFQNDPAGRNSLVAQGGGDYAEGHRCPGEPATVELMAEGIRRLVGLRYRLPDQDLRVSLRRMPAGPASGLVIELKR